MRGDAGTDELSKGALVAQLRALGVREGGVLLVHTAFRAVRPVAGGPEGLIEALREALGADGTLVRPSWTGDDDAPFAHRATPASADLGVVADTFWRMPGVVRSRDVVALAVEALARDPLLFLHGPEARCEECDAARASIAPASVAPPRQQITPPPSLA